MTEATRILLVEDNELNRDMLIRRLNRAGIEVIVAENGQQALDKMLAEQPAVVLMDMNLPVMDGWTASRKAREDERIRDIPIIALTAHAYATKPVDFPGLLIKIEKLARR